MTRELDVADRWPPRDPQVLHCEAAADEDAVDDPQWDADARPPDRDAVPRAGLEVHVDDSVGEQEAGNGVPGPGLDPPGGQDEDGAGFDAPAGARVGDQDHGHVDSVALGVDDVDAPESLGGEGLAAGLGGEVEGRPEEVEDRVEVGEGVVEGVGGLERGVTGRLLEAVDVFEACFGEGELDDCEADGDGEP